MILIFLKDQIYISIYIYIYIERERERESHLQSCALLWEKAGCVGHPVRFELTSNGLPVLFANYYTTKEPIHSISNLTLYLIYIPPTGVYFVHTYKYIQSYRPYIWLDFNSFGFSDFFSLFKRVSFPLFLFTVNFSVIVFFFLLFLFSFYFSFFPSFPVFPFLFTWKSFFTSFF